MASRTIRVQFLPDAVANEVVADPEVHDISINDDVVGAPQILENPHVDFPGMWQLVGGSASAVDDAPASHTSAAAEPNTAVAAGSGAGRVDAADGGPDGVLRYVRYDAVGETNNVRTD